jgi:hypothetical protein
MNDIQRSLLATLPRETSRRSPERQVRLQHRRLFHAFDTEPGRLRQTGQVEQHELDTGRELPVVDVDLTTRYGEWRQAPRGEQPVRFERSVTG